jgi:hypothetical protein
MDSEEKVGAGELKSFSLLHLVLLLALSDNFVEKAQNNTVFSQNKINEPGGI